MPGVALEGPRTKAGGERASVGGPSRPGRGARRRGRARGRGTPRQPGQDTVVPAASPGRRRVRVHHLSSSRWPSSSPGRHWTPRRSRHGQRPRQFGTRTSPERPRFRAFL